MEASLKICGAADGVDGWAARKIDVDSTPQLAVETGKTKSALGFERIRAFSAGGRLKTEC
jgi:hypothetical protein